MTFKITLGPDSPYPRIDFRIVLESFDPGARREALKPAAPLYFLRALLPGTTFHYQGGGLIPDPSVEIYPLAMKKYMAGEWSDGWSYAPALYRFGSCGAAEDETNGIQPSTRGSLKLASLATGLEQSRKVAVWRSKVDACMRHAVWLRLRMACSATDQRPGCYDHRIRLDPGVTRSLRSRHATVAAASKAELRRHAALSARVTAALGTIQPSSVVIARLDGPVVDPRD